MSRDGNEPFKVGDKVRRLTDCAWRDVAAGDVGIVTSVERYGAGGLSWYRLDLDEQDGEKLRHPHAHRNLELVEAAEGDTRSVTIPGALDLTQRIKTIEAAVEAMMYLVPDGVSGLLVDRAASELVKVIDAFHQVLGRIVAEAWNED